MAPINGVRIIFGGSPRVLRFTNRALIALENESGFTVMQLAQRLGQGSVKAAAQLIWAGLIHADPKLTVDQVADMMDVRKLEEIGGSVREAMEQAFGDEEPEAGKAEVA